MFSVVLKPSSELCFGWWSCSNLPRLTLAEVHQLAIFQMHREGNDGRRPTAHGKIEQPPAGFTCPYTLEVLVLTNLIASFWRDLVSWCIMNHCMVVTFVDVFKEVFAGFDRRAGFNINVASVLLQEVWVEGHYPPVVNSLPTYHLLPPPCVRGTSTVFWYRFIVLP